MIATMPTKKVLHEKIDRLPDDKIASVSDYVDFLIGRSSAKDGDERWEEIIADPRPRPKLEAYADAALAEGGDDELDPEKL